MAYTPSATPTDKSPSHHATLYDGTTKVGIIFCDEQGNENELAIITSPYEQSAFKMVSGSSKYDDNEPPFSPVAQEDWSGGRGQEDFEADKSRYFDAGGIDTINGRDGLILCGLPTYSSGVHNVQQKMPGNVTWRGLYDTRQYLSTSFVANATYAFNTTAGNAWVKIRKVGAPATSLYFKIYSDNAGKPDSSLVASAAIPHTAVTDTLGVTINFILAPGTALTSGTTYHIVIYANGAGTATNHWEVACDSTAANCRSSDGAEWTTETGYAPYYRFFLTTDKTFKAHFFEYKGQLYFATQPDDDTAGKLYMNGWRGACDSNSTDLSLLNDATAPGFASNELIGCVAKIVEGNSARVYQTWRKIISNTTTAIEVSPDWNTIHTTSDSYVILGSNNWKQITSTYLGSDIFTQPISDVAVCNGIVYLTNTKPSTRVEKIGAAKYQEYNGAGIWQQEFGPTGFEAQHIEVIHDEILGPCIWLGRINYDDEFYSDLHRVVAPVKWSQNELLSGTILDDCMDIWGESDPVSGVTCKKGYPNSIGFDITGTFTTGIIGSEAISSTDVRPFDILSFKIYSSVNLDAGVLQICLDNTAKCASPVVIADVPALTANVWRTVELPITTNVAGAEAIISIGLNCTTDQDKTFSVWISGPVRAFNTYLPILIEGRITGIGSYGERKIPYVFTEDNFGKIENNFYIPADLPGYKELASEYNGAAIGKYDVYLLFSLGSMVSRYYEGAMDNLGPTNDAGMPADRKGHVSAFATFGDQFYIAYDGGYDNYSCIMCYKSSGWHEVFRSPLVGERIRNIYVQAMPDTEYARLWISMGRDILWIPISLNPFSDEDYRYIDEGYLETSWIYTDRRDIKKLYNKLKIFCENVSANNYYIEADYKLDGDTTWTPIIGDFDTEPSEEISLSASSPPTSSGKRIKLRLRMITNDCTKTPRIKSIILDTVGFAPTKYIHTCHYKIADGDLNIDLRDRKDTTFTDVATAVAKLREWSDNATFLTLDCVYAIIHNKTVFIMPSASRPISIDYETKAGKGHEEHLGYLTLFEV